MQRIRSNGADQPPPDAPAVPVFAPVAMMVFWVLLGAAAGIKVMQSIWRLLGVEGGQVAIAVPAGGTVGALIGALLGLISNPRLLVLLMAVFAGASAGGVAGQLPWGDAGEIGGQVAGGMIGGIAWAIWLFTWGREGVHTGRSRSQPSRLLDSGCRSESGSQLPRWPEEFDHE